MGKPFYTRLALLGIAMYLAIEVILLVVTLLFLPRSDLWYPLLVGGLALAGGAVIYFWHPWGLIVGVVGGLIGIMFSLDSIGTNLSSPDSFFDFAYRPVIWGGGTVLLLAGSTAGLVQHFRRRTSSAGPVPVVRAAQGLVGLVMVISLFSAVLTVASVDRVSADARAGATVVTISGWKFSKDALTIPGNGSTSLVIENKDAVVHSFTLDGLEMDKRLGPFEEARVVFDSPPPGRYKYRCRIPGHGSMRGTLMVE